jgi:DNA-binding NtrC family response regulator
MASTTEALRVLLVEDDEDDYLITRDMLGAQERAHFVVEWCPDYHQGLEAIRREDHDVYLIDYRLGANTGLELVREGFADRPRAPVIILTGQSDYEIDLEATALGVTDYLVKQELDPAGTLDPVRDQSPTGAERPDSERGALCPRRSRRQRRHLGLGSKRGSHLLLAAVACHPRAARALGR